MEGRRFRDDVDDDHVPVVASRAFVEAMACDSFIVIAGVVGLFIRQRRSRRHAE
jgi:hypothetical protein